MMKYLTRSGGVVAVLFEVPGQADHPRQIGSPVLLIVIDACGGGTQAGEQSHTRRITQRRSAMRVAEKNSAFGERIDVRCPDSGIAAQASDPIVHVVYREEQHIRALPFPECGGGERSAQQFPSSDHT